MYLFHRMNRKRIASLCRAIASSDRKQFKTEKQVIKIEKNMSICLDSEPSPYSFTSLTTYVTELISPAPTYF
ncbi:hypothetical protein BpHYR1_030681 [Brachionus plicatilis]|uniref:Uncharacterized protein n=1 Tax=Brachionus plicatilis TaxID=10195 RepID=A0A3M7R7D0_BRAPC|nr:hypothetical protein BpHYR1_030681 [Brachionus plicatilis]